MNRTLTLILSIFLAFALCGCTPAEPEAETVATFATEETTPASPTVGLPQKEARRNTVLDAYKAVLSGEDVFVDAYTGAVLRVEDGSITDNYDVTTTPYKFTILDLDGDGVEEMILWLRADEDTQAGFWVLRNQADCIRGYSLTYRNFDRLKADGTFICDIGPTFDEEGMQEVGLGIGRMRFTDTSWEMDYSARSRLILDQSADIVSASFTVDGAEVTNDDFLAAQDAHKEKPDVRWYYLTMDNLARASEAPAETNLVDILTGNGVFYSRNSRDHMYMTLEQYLAWFTPETETFKIAAVDIDADGTRELALKLSGDNTLILHQQGTEVHGQVFDWAELRELKSDGTYLWGFDGTCYGAARLTMDPGIWLRDETYLYSASNGSYEIWVKGVRASESVFQQAVEEQAAKEDAHWVDYPYEDYSELIN